MVFREAQKRRRRKVTGKKSKWKTENVKLSFIGLSWKLITKDEGAQVFSVLDAGIEEDP